MRGWWYKILFFHALSWGLEASLYLTSFALIAWFGVKYEILGFEQAVLSALIISLGVLTLRLKRVWKLKSLFSHLEGTHPQLRGYLQVTKDFLQERQHAPAPEMRDLAMSQLHDKIKDLSYPFTRTFFSGHRELFIGAILFFIPVLVNFVLQKTEEKTYHKIELVPPAYLNLESISASKQQKRFKVYPGTLFKCTLLKNADSYKLKDSLGSYFVPTHKKNGASVFTVRVLREKSIELHREGKKVFSWKLNFLEDEFPQVSWTHKRDVSTSWEEQTVRFQASDDIALQDAFIVVDGQELEYAGTPTGEKQYFYSWRFSPLEFLDLSGGNVELQVSVYDQDRVLGPKSSLTKKIVWVYKGVLKETQEQLSRLEDLEKGIHERLLPLKKSPQAPAPQLVEKMSLANSEISKSPVLPDNLKAMMRSMTYRYSSLQNRLSRTTPTPTLQKEEEAELEKDLLYIDLIKSRLETMLATVETADLMAEMQAMSQKLKNNEEVNPEKMNDLYEKLESALDKMNGVPEGLKKAMLQKMEEAQMAQMMGDKKHASDLMDAISEQLGEMANQNNPAQSKLSAMFQKKMSQLNELVKKQGENILKSQKESSQSKLKKHPTLLARIGKLIHDIELLPSIASYEKLAEDFRKIHQSGKNSPEATQLLKRLTEPNSLESHGMRLRGTTVGLRKVRNSLFSEQKSNFSASLSFLTPPSQFNRSNVSKELSTKYKEVFDELMQIRSEKAAPPNFSSSVKKRQEQLAQEGMLFSKDFRSEFSQVLPQPNLFGLSDTGAARAREADRLLQSKQKGSMASMNSAYLSWKNLKDLLDEAQESSAKAMSRAMSMGLKIGKDGKLRMGKKKGQKGKKEGKDGESMDDVAIPLPEEFEKVSDIEKRLKKELEGMKDSKNFELFKSYMLDLLQ